MIPEITFAGRQAMGSRDNQEDTYGFCLLETGPEPTLLLALADGMGGHERGEIASELAASTFIRTVQLGTSDLRRAMLAAVEAANDRVRAENERRGGKPDEMGTTLVALHVCQDRLQWVSVGDSPLYLYRNAALLRINEEHAMPVEVAGAPPRGMLLSALTGGRIRQIDAPPRPVLLEPGDIIVCASDGIHTCDHDRLSARLETLADLPAGELADALIETVEGVRLANQDNVTIAIIKFQPAGAAAEPVTPEATAEPAARPS